jgi:hypothetical protein
MFTNIPLQIKHMIKRFFTKFRRIWRNKRQMDYAPRSGGTKILRVVKCIWHVAPKFKRARAVLLFLILNVAKAFANFA